VEKPGNSKEVEDGEESKGRGGTRGRGKRIVDPTEVPVGVLLVAAVD
jgi:hypothetical protein